MSFYTVNYLCFSNLETFFYRSFYFGIYSFVIKLAIEVIGAELLLIAIATLGLTTDNVADTLFELDLLKNSGIF